MKKFAIMLFLMLLAGNIQAQTAGMVVSLDQPRAAVKPQTDEEKEFGKQNGRQLPALETLQPTLDVNLKAFVPNKKLKLKGDFKGASSDVMSGLANLWFAAFKRYYPNVKLNIAPPYAGSLGAKELIKGNLDFVFVSRELKPDDISEFKAKFGYDPLSIPISGGSYRHYGFLDAIGFMVNKDNPLEKISFDQIDAMMSKTYFRGGKPITKWGQMGLRGDWADKPIHIYGIKPWNGFEEYIRQRILSYNGNRGEWNDSINFAPVVFPIAKSVANDRYGIGYAGLAYIDTGVKLLPIGGSTDTEFYAPTYENVATAKYPLCRLIYFNVNKPKGKPLNPALEEFLRFILSREGQQIVLNQGLYLPLRENQAQIGRDLLSN